MEYTFRWFGPQDPSKLKEIRQIGINGIVTSLANVKYGQKWSSEDIKKRKSFIESFKVNKSKKLNWSVVESLPVHNDIKKRSGNYKYFIDQYKDSLVNLAKNKVTNICYNFMPLIDWVRTDLNFELERRPKWPENGHTKTTFEFYKKVFNSSNVMGIFAGHIHQNSIEIINGKPQIVSDDNASGAYLDIDFILSNTLVGKSLLNSLKKEEELKINKFKNSDEEFKNEEKSILAKKKLISNDEFNKEIKILQIKFQEYRNNKVKEIDALKKKRNNNIVNLLNLINPIIEKYMAENSIYMLIDKKNVFIASKNFDITNKLIELIDNQIKTVDIK